MAVTWTIESNGGVYDKTPGAENTFRWTIPESALTNYNAVYCQGYDTITDNITGTIKLKNKAATPVTITGTDSSISYTGATIDGCGQVPGPARPRLPPAGGLAERKSSSPVAAVFSFAILPDFLFAAPVSRDKRPAVPRLFWFFLFPSHMSRPEYAR